MTTKHNLFTLFQACRIISRHYKAFSKYQKDYGQIWQLNITLWLSDITSHPNMDPEDIVDVLFSICAARVEKLRILGYNNCSEKEIKFVEQERNKEPALFTHFLYSSWTDLSVSVERALNRNKNFHE